MIPYTIMLAIVGLPMFFMELALGQFASLGPITVWKVCPMFKGMCACVSVCVRSPKSWRFELTLKDVARKPMHLSAGIGVGMVAVSTFVAIYYNIVISYAIFYLAASFAKVQSEKVSETTQH